jgi:hypothetical protein
MPDKNFTFRGRNLVVRDPANLVFTSAFMEETYQYFFGRLAGGGPYGPQIDIDALLAGAAPFDIVARAVHHGEVVGQPAAGAADRNQAIVQYHVRHFLEKHPELFGFIQNVVGSAEIAIRNARFLLGRDIDGTNFITAKSVIDEIARSTWTRAGNLSERQSGVSVLGQISETLLSTALQPLLGPSFFRVNGRDVKAYGDFVAICLPNNLWISVKSNYARERLLASGYSNDIAGAGFFVDAREFTNPVRIRNFQRAGFLAMYVPDVAVTEEQAANNTSTYQLVRDHYNNVGQPAPININGKPFIRALSSLPGDIAALLAEDAVSRRLTVSF